MRITEVDWDEINTIGKKSEERHIFKCRQHKNIEKIEDKNERKRKKG